MTDPITVETLIKEGAITLAEAAKLLPVTRGKKKHITSLVRWILQGKHGIRLEASRGPDKGWFTSRQAVARFCARVTAAEAHEPIPLNIEQQDRERRAKAAMERMFGKKRR